MAFRAVLPPATLVYMTHSAVVIRFEAASTLRTREKGWDVSDPPQKNRGVMRPFVAVGCDIPLLGPMTGRSRPHLSLREGSEQHPTSWFFPGGGRGAGGLVGRVNFSVA